MVVIMAVVMVEGRVGAEVMVIDDYEVMVMMTVVVVVMEIMMLLLAWLLCSSGKIQ